MTGCGEHGGVTAFQGRVAGAVLGAPGGQFRRGAVEDDLAGVDQRDLRTGRADVLDEVSGHHDGGTLAEVAQQGAEMDSLLGVEPGGRLVEQQQFQAR